MSKIGDLKVDVDVDKRQFDRAIERYTEFKRNMLRSPMLQAVATATAMRFVPGAVQSVRQMNELRESVVPYTMDERDFDRMKRNSIALYEWALERGLTDGINVPYVLRNLAQHHRSQWSAGEEPFGYRWFDMPDWQRIEDSKREWQCRMYERPSGDVAQDGVRSFHRLSVSAVWGGDRLMWTWGFYCAFDSKQIKRATTFAPKAPMPRLYGTTFDAMIEGVRWYRSNRDDMLAADDVRLATMFPHLRG